MNSSLPPKTIFPLLAIVICVLVGCDTAPRLTFDSHWAKNQDLSQSEVDFTWPVKDGVLRVARPMPFAFIQQLDPRQLGWPKGDVNAKLDLSVFPTELHRHLRNCFAEGEQSLTMAMHVQEENLSGKFAFALSRTGSGLVTVSDQLRIWNVRTGKMLGEPRALPSANITAVTFDRNEKHVIVADDEKLYRLSLPDGDVVNAIARPKGEIRQWLRAAEGNVICVLTESGDVFVCYDDLSQLQSFPKRLSGQSQSVAINSAGTEVLVLDGSALSTIPLSGIQFQQELAILKTSRQDYLLCNDYDKNYLFSDLYFSQALTAAACRAALGGKGMRLETTGRFNNSGFLWRSIDAAIQIDKTASWPAIVVLSERPTKNGQPQYVLSEVLPRSQGMSSAAVLRECESPGRIQLSNEGLRVAVYDSGSVRIYRRDERHFRGTELLREIGRHLVREGTTEQIEAFSSFLSRQGNSHFGLNPNELYAHFIDDAGHAWAELQLYHQDQAERLAMLDNWYRQGSEAALLLSSRRHIDMALIRNYQFDGKFLVPVQKDLAPLNTGPTPHTLANHFQTLAEAKAVNLDLMEQHVRTSLESDASFFPTLYDVAFFVKPNMIQTKEDCPLYAGAIADLHGDRGDATYAKLIASVANPTTVRIFPQYPFDTERLFSGTRALVESNQANADFLFGLGWIAASYQQHDVAKEVLQHIQQQIGFVPLKTKDPCNVEAFIQYVDSDK
ncbi:hypothetical protein SH528x_004169 [Novipirellula sp. SH528]|uniref:hypothetical protein n=1 Tax=Novipirellula sp. SH528 TaxID=3454466 RepID=UPI003F9F183D